MAAGDCGWRPGPVPRPSAADTGRPTIMLVLGWNWQFSRRPVCPGKNSDGMPSPAVGRDGWECWSDWSSSWEVLDEEWSLPSQGWVTTSCLPWQDSHWGDLLLLPCFSVQFPNWNFWRPMWLAFKGGYSARAAAVFLTAVPSTWQQCYYWCSHVSIHRQVYSPYKDAK